MNSLAHRSASPYGNSGKAGGGGWNFRKFSQRGTSMADSVSADSSHSSRKHDRTGVEGTTMTTTTTMGRISFDKVSNNNAVRRTFFPGSSNHASQRAAATAATAANHRPGTTTNTINNNSNTANATTTTMTDANGATVVVKKKPYRARGCRGGARRGKRALKAAAEAAAAAAAAAAANESKPASPNPAESRDDTEQTSFKGDQIVTNSTATTEGSSTTGSVLSVTADCCTESREGYGKGKEQHETTILRSRASSLESGLGKKSGALKKNLQHSFSFSSAFSHGHHSNPVLEGPNHQERGMHVVDASLVHPQLRGMPEGNTGGQSNFTQGEHGLFRDARMFPGSQLPPSTATDAAIATSGGFISHDAPPFVPSSVHPAAVSFEHYHAMMMMYAGHHDDNHNSQQPSSSDNSYHPNVIHHQANHSNMMGDQWANAQLSNGMHPTALQQAVQVAPPEPHVGTTRDLRVLPPLPTSGIPRNRLHSREEAQATRQAAASSNVATHSREDNVYINMQQESFSVENQPSVSMPWLENVGSSVLGFAGITQVSRGVSASMETITGGNGSKTDVVLGVAQGDNGNSSVFTTGADEQEKIRDHAGKESLLRVGIEGTDSIAEATATPAATATAAPPAPSLNEFFECYADALCAGSLFEVSPRSFLMGGKRRYSKEPPATDEGADMDVPLMDKENETSFTLAAEGEQHSSVLSPTSKHNHVTGGDQTVTAPKELIHKTPRPTTESARGALF